MEGYCLTGESPQRVVVPLEEEELVISASKYSHNISADSLET
jgi:hypothetical protein